MLSIILRLCSTFRTLLFFLNPSLFLSLYHFLFEFLDFIKVASENRKERERGREKKEEKNSFERLIRLVSMTVKSVIQERMCCITNSFRIPLLLLNNRLFKANIVSVISPPALPRFLPLSPSLSLSLSLYFVSFFISFTLSQSSFSSFFSSPLSGSGNCNGF